VTGPAGPPEPGEPAVPAPAGADSAESESASDSAASESVGEGSAAPASGSAGVTRAAPDPWKGFRGVLAATLILESIVVLLTLLVVTKVGDNGGTLGVVVVLALAVAMIMTTRYLGRPWGPWLGAALQIVMIVCGFLVGALGALGVVFALVWGGLLAMRRDVAAKMARGELPSQRQ
jgi:Protein of unknown function (DUF4233)